MTDAAYLTKAFDSNMYIQIAEVLYISILSIMLDCFCHKTLRNTFVTMVKPKEK